MDSPRHFFFFRRDPCRGALGTTGLWVILCLVVSIWNAASDLRLTAGLDRATGQAWLSIPPETNFYGYFNVQVSTNLETWDDFGRFVQLVSSYSDGNTKEEGQRYFRAVEVPMEAQATNWWANQINDRTRGLTKFVIMTNDPDRVFFHSGSILHYAFASRQFPEVAAAGPEAFDEAAIHPARQKIILGGIVSVPTGENAYGIEFVSAEPMDPARLVELFRTVTNRIALAGMQPFLLPSSIQLESVQANADYFKKQGVPVREWKEFLTNRTVQSEGWSIGTLKYIRSADLPAAIARGELSPDTILITDEVPRELPPIGGLISLSASSPNSHTVIRLAAHSLPYVDWPTILTGSLSNLVGQRVLFAADVLAQRYLVDYEPRTELRLSRVDDLPGLIRTELESRQENASLKAPPMERFGAYGTNTDGLSVDDTKYFGSKAAQYGLIRKAIPGASRPAVALSFDLWLDFMGQKLASGKTLRETIDEEIARGTNRAALVDGLKAIRKLIEDTAVFSAEQKAAVIGLLDASPFSRGSKLRFRSSSNAEDLPGFSGAGLYDSYSGCLLDDLEGVSGDVCLCDPADTKARSVFRAIQKVYASFYNEQAFIERRQYGIDEKTVGMAVLVHHSFPDEEELANGVATVEPYFSSYRIASQRGAVSVANPEGPDLPEIYELPRQEAVFGLGQITQYSTIRPKGIPVLGSDDRYLELVNLLMKVANVYPSRPGSENLQLNFEFKDTAGGLVVKQVRSIKPADSAGTMILPAAVDWETYQGGGIYASFTNQPTIESSHQLKSFLHGEFNGGVTDDLGRAFGGLETVTARYINGTEIVSNTFHFTSSQWLLTNLPNNYYSAQKQSSIRRSRYTSTDGQSIDLDFLFRAEGAPGTPFLNAKDVMAQMSRPGIAGVAELVSSWEMNPPTVLNSGNYIVRTKTATTNGVSITTIYNLGVHPQIPIVGIGPTLGLVDWNETEISGLVSRPFKLKGSYSQTYGASRHNVIEFFVFEPRLEENLPAEILQELVSADIKQILVSGVYVTSETGPQVRQQIEIVGYGGRRRPL